MNPDIIHARSRVPAWLGFLANRSLKRPFVTTVHGFNSVNAYSKVMTYGDRVICVSNAVKEYVKKNYGTPDDKMVVIPRGVDLDHFDPKKVDRKFIQVFSERYGLKGKFVVTSVGRITQLKDYETFISALVMIKRDIPEAVALIVGGVHEDRKEYFAKLQQMVKNIQSESYIHFTGSQSNVAEIYAMSNIVVSSSRKPESFGRSAAEALAMNVPVVATGHGGILDIVIDGKTGFLFEPGDPEGLACAVEKCRERKMEDLRNFVVSNFTLDQMVDQTLSVYQDLLHS